MKFRLRSNGLLLSQDELIAQFPNVQLHVEQNLTATYLDPLGVDPVYDYASPTVGWTQIAEEQAPIQDHGRWVIDWIVRDLTPEELAAKGPEIISVNAWQIRRALNALGLRAAVEDFIKNSGDQDLIDGWEFSAHFESTHGFVTSVGTGIGKTEAQIIDVFRLAITL